MNEVVHKLKQPRCVFDQSATVIPANPALIEGVEKHLVPKTENSRVESSRVVEIQHGNTASEPNVTV